MNQQKGKWAAVALAMAILAFTPLAHAGLVVIASANAPVDSLTADQVKALFLQKEKSLPDGTPVELADQKTDSDAYEQFARQVIGKSPKKLKRYWSKRVFSGKGVPPKVVGDDAAVKAWVSQSPGRLGYVDESVLDDSVKVVFKP